MDGQDCVFLAQIDARVVDCFETPCKAMLALDRLYREWLDVSQQYQKQGRR